MKRRAIRTLCAVLLLATLAGASGESVKEKSLYDRLGGKKVITAVVDEFVARAAADSRINGFFQQTAADPARLPSFKAKLVDQICQASGGPWQYTGKDMKSPTLAWGSPTPISTLW